jgi:hypothetical protein
MDDALKIKAYELLIEDQQKQIKDLIHLADHRHDPYMLAVKHLNEFIFKHHGYKALYQLGKEIDKAYAPENNGRAYGFAESIEIDYEHRK